MVQPFCNMARDPAFLFYTGDFSTGTQFFTDAQVGIFLRLLMAQHQHGRLTEKQMLFISKSHDKDIMQKFVKDDSGLFYNVRLESEILKRKEYSLSRSGNRKGKQKKNKEDINIISKTYLKDMENENKDKDINNKEKFENLKFELFNSATWISDCERTLKTQNIKTFLKEFLDELFLKDDIYKDISEVKKHFVNWVKIQLEKKKKQTSQKEVHTTKDLTIGIPDHMK